MASSSVCSLNSLSATTARVTDGPRSSLQPGAARMLGPVHGLGFSSSKHLRTTELRGSSPVVAMATESSSTETAASDLLKSIQEAWEKTDDKLAVGGLGFAGLIVLWASTGLISAIDKLPIIPTFFELVGLIFTGWFIYRYLLFKPDREELLKKVDETKAKITGSS